MSDARPDILLKNEEKTHEQVAAELQGLAEMAALEGRIARAVGRFGRRVYVGITLRDMYTAIAESLEEGANAIETLQGSLAGSKRKGRR